MNWLPDDFRKQVRVVVAQALSELGWTKGHNVQIVCHGGRRQYRAIRMYATELVATKGVTAMRLLKALSCTTLAIVVISNISVAAETGYMPSLGDIMAGIQLRHAKLWYAAKVKNWSLADYELRELNSTLEQATRVFPSVPGSDMTNTEQRMVLLREAIKAKDDVKFNQAFRQMTNACNGCHEATGRAFIVIRMPVFPSPYSNQVFAPRAKVPATR